MKQRTPVDIYLLLLGPLCCLDTTVNC